MFNLKFGIVWTIFTTILGGVFLFAPGEADSSAESNIFLYIFLIVFEIIGIYLIVSGTKKVIKDKKTENHGIETFGQIISISNTGSYQNNVPELKAKVTTYLPQEKAVENIEEIIGFAPTNYSVGEFVKLAYYEGDINIIGLVSEIDVPSDIKNIILQETHKNDTIVVNNQVYVKQENNNQNNYDDYNQRF